MIDPSKQRWLLIALSHCALYFVVSQVNHYTSPFTLNAMILGVFAGFSGLCLTFTQGVLSLAPVALIFDSRSPLEFGTVFILSFTSFAIVYYFRHQFHKESKAAAVIVSLMSNALIFVGITFLATVGLRSQSTNLTHILANLTWSSLVVLLLSKFYFDFLYAMLAVFGIHLAEEQRTDQ